MTALIRYGEVFVSLKELTSIQEVMIVYRRAEAEQEQAGAIDDREWEHDAFELSIWSQRRLGQLLHARKLDKDAWIAKARVDFGRSQRKPCFVCGKFRDIAHAHHIVPLAAQFDRGFKVPDQEHVWLCPNHHAIIHRLIWPEDSSVSEAMMIAVGAATAGLITECSTEEIRLLLELLSMAGRGK